MRKIYSLLLAVVMMMAMAVPAFAANNDPNMTNVESEAVTVLQKSNSDQTVTLLVAPANSYYQATYFTTQEAADNVQWSVITDKINTVKDVDYSMGVEIDTNQFASMADVTIPGGTEAGSISVMATNPLTGAYYNFTIVIDENIASVANIDASYYNNNTFIMDKAGMTVKAADVSTANINFPTAFDAVYRTWVDGLGQYPQISARIMNYGYVSSLTFMLTATGTPLELAEYTEGSNYYGWQYRAYDETGAIVPLSKYVGADNIRLFDGYTVMWKFGLMDGVTFPQSVK